MTRTFVFVAILIFSGPAGAQDGWLASPAHFAGVAREQSKLVLDSAKWSGKTPPGRWGYLWAPEESSNVAIAADVAILEPAKQFRFFGEGWSVWPDHAFADQGFEAALSLRAGEGTPPKEREFGYRVQLSHKYQCLALVKYPLGGYLRVVPFPVKLNQPHRVEAEIVGKEIIVRVDGEVRIHFVDHLLPLAKGRVGVGVSSGAKIVVDKIAVRTIVPGIEKVWSKVHRPNFSVRNFLGDRPWVFDGDEPVMLLPTTKANYINNVKLRPGYKPQLSWNSHWDIQNQGAFPEGTNNIGDVATSGGGDSLTARWTAKQTKGRFETRTTLTVGWDNERGVYRYDVDSELEVLPGEPFHFRYGYDFEHHTPLDPFNWQYLVVRREGDKLNHRPVYPIDPGPMYTVESYKGLRMWYGRHNEKMPVAPTVEYDIDPELNRDSADPTKAKYRKLNTAVCAAFYDTGVSFESETAKPGTKVRVKYRYTGYPAEEAERLFAASTVYDSKAGGLITLDVDHHWIFADEWPKLTFSKFVPLGQTWQYGRTPFRGNGWNTVRPNYHLAKDTGVGSGFAMRLGPLGHAEAPWKPAAPLPAGRYALMARCKADNLHGAGGRIELKAKETKKDLLHVKHFVGKGSFGWKTVGFLFELPAEASQFHLTLANGGTGDVLFTDVEIVRESIGALPRTVSTARDTPPAFPPVPKGAVADFRMVEQKAQHALDFARGPFGLLELGNVTWTTDADRPALKFADNETGRKDFPRAGVLERSYFSTPGYQKVQDVPVAIAGHHGGGSEWDAFTLAAFVKPAAQMPKNRSGYSDVMGLGGRRVILSLAGQQAPYRLNARLNVNDVFTAAEAKVSADHWQHVAVTGEATADKQWRVKLYLDGAVVQEGMTKKFAAPSVMPPSLVLGTEIFYFHDAYYRGLIGRTLVFRRALSVAEIQELAAQR